jgi:thiaminase (transcriptional activator TenA)
MSGFTMKFSDTLWEQIAPIYQSIIYHPFNVELAQGTLDQERFAFYMEQDAFYLVGFSRALAFIAARTDSSKTIRQFLDFSIGALVAERELHTKFLAPNYNSDNFEPSPACIAYVNYLISTAATAPLEEAVAAVLPCFWIYREIGRSIAVHVNENNPYALWIETYSSKEFSEATDRAISVLDEMANQCSANSLDRVKNAFEYSSLFEWHFWDDAFNMVVFRKAYAKKNQLGGVYAA